MGSRAAIPAQPMQAQKNAMLHASKSLRILPRPATTTAVLGAPSQAVYWACWWQTHMPIASQHARFPACYDNLHSGFSRVLLLSRLQRGLWVLLLLRPFIGCSDCAKLGEVLK